MNEPSKIPVGFAASGDKNTIPETTTTQGAASWAAGFPAITSVPVTQGGVSPTRADFNGIFNALSMGLMWLQHGNHYSYDDSIDYNPGALAASDGALYFCKQANGPTTEVVEPGSDASVWGLLLNAEGNSTINTSGHAGNASVATKALQDGDGNVIKDTYLKQADAADTYLPLSGGTMTGLLTLKTEYAPPNFQIKLDNDDGRLVLCGGTGISSSYLRLAGKDEGNVDLLQLAGVDSDGNNFPLNITNTGDLTFATKSVERVESFVSNSDSYGIRFSSGLQICWGGLGAAEATAQRIYFPVVFKSAPSVSVIPVSSVTTSEYTVKVYDILSASFAFSKFQGTSLTTASFWTSYLAIGRWK